MEGLQILSTAELLELLRGQHKIKGLPVSDYYLSRVLEVSPQSVDRWLHHGQPMSDEKAFLLGDRLNLPYSYMLLCMQYERAKTEEARQAMQEIADKFLKASVFILAASALLYPSLALIVTRFA